MRADMYVPTARRRLRIRVTARPNPGHPGAVLLDFAEDCPYCGKRHQHGSLSAQPSPDGTYGQRAIHCADHTHELTASGKRRRVARDNRCCEWHPAYLLVPAEGSDVR